MRSNFLKYGFAAGVISVSVLALMAQPVSRKSATARTLPSVVQPATMKSGQALPGSTSQLEAGSNPARPQIPAMSAAGAQKGQKHSWFGDPAETRIYFAVNPQDNKLRTPGVYWIDINDPTHTFHRIGSSSPKSDYGGVAVDDIYYATQVYSSPLKDWTVKWSIPDSMAFTGTVYDGYYYLWGTDFTYDPYTDRIVGNVIMNYSKSIYSLCVIDYDKHTKEPFGPEYAYTKRFQSVAAGPDCYYCVDYNFNFFKVDKFTGEATEVGPTGLRTSIIYGMSMIYEPKTKKLYMSAVDSNRGSKSSLFIIDPESGKSLGTVFEDSLQERRHGLFVDEPTTSACPALATNLSVDFPVGELTGSITFTAPSTTVGGAPATGTLKYTVLANGKPVATGDVTGGSTVTAPITIPGAGSYKFSVKTENNVGPSRWARHETALGFAKPGVPKARMQYEEGIFSIDWDDVTLSAAGVQLDTAQITYKVTRYPDMVVVSEGGKLTSCTDNLTPGEELKTYYYGVQAVYGGIAESDAGFTNSRTFGHILAPWKEDFQDHKHLEAFTIIDVNGDGRTWSFDSIYGRTDLECQSSLQYEVNDYLITPPVKMEPGYFYQINYSLSNKLADYYDPELVRIHMGTAPTVAGLSTLLLDTTAIKGRDWVRVGSYAKVETAGDYYFGLQVVNDNKGRILYMRDVSISTPVSFKAPGFATNASLSSSYDDPSNVDITFTTPTTCADGTPLQSIERLEVLRGDTLVVTYNNPRVGTVIHCTDMVNERGRDYAYTIVAYNAEGRGQEMVVEDFVGIRKPTAATAVQGWENNGQVTLTWKAPEVDERGNRLNPANVRYDIQYREGTYVVHSVAKNHEGTTITFPYTIDDPTVPSFLSVTVKAVTEGGESEETLAYPVGLGNPHSVPFIESFAGASYVHPIGVIKLSGDAAWNLYSDASFTDLKSCDEDGGMIGMQAQQAGATGLMTFAKIDMSQMNKPVLNFMIYNITGSSPDTNEFDVLINDGTGFKSVYHGVVRDFGGAGWNKVTVPLSAYKGKTVQLALTATTRAYVYSLFDNFRLVEQLSDNLAISQFSGPANVAANSPASFQLKVENNGENLANGFKVILYRDHSKYMEVPVDAVLASGTSTTVNIPVEFTTVDPDRAVFTAVVDYDPDLDLDDNISGEVVVNVAKQNLPKPTAFTVSANGTDDGAELSWSAPDYSDVSFESVTESFETATPWNSTRAGDWTLVNKNPTTIGGANGISFPGGIQGSTAGFFTFRYGDDTQFNQSWTPYEGQQMLVMVYAQNGSKSNAWAISPLLSGQAQSVSVRARSYSADYAESFRIMYSTTDANPESFVEAKAFNNIPAEWTLYTADLPAGAKYVAINGVSQDKFMLFIDNITYLPGGTLNLLGYHVYRDGKRLNVEALASTSYTDALPQGGTFGYQLTAMYDRGESRPTDLTNITVRSVGEILTGVNVYAENGQIVVAGAEGEKVNVTTINGIRLYSGVPSATLHLNASAGVYLVQVGNATIKLMVK